MLRKVDEQWIFRYQSVPQAAFTADSTTDLLTSNGHGLYNGDIIQVSNSGGGLPGGLSASSDYYILNSSTNTFQISTTPNGSPINMTSNGTGTQTYRLKGRVILTDGYQHVKLTIVTANSANMVGYIQGSNSFNQPEFFNSVSPTNEWFYKQVKDEATGTTINGGSDVIKATGTDISYEYEINVNAVRFLTLILPFASYAAGTVDVRVSLFDSSQN